MTSTKRIVMVRHGQAAHNIKNDFTLHDPLLSSQGELECRSILGDRFLQEYPHADKIDLVVVSPLIRTLQTTRFGFKQYLENKDVPVVVFAGIQETSAKPCDTGSHPDILGTEFPEFHFGNLDEEFRNKHDTIYAPSQLTERATMVREWLHNRTESHILVVSHSGFLRHMTPHDFPFIKNRDMYRNCEYREYCFGGDAQDTSHGAPYKLLETEWSKQLRKRKRAETVTLKLQSGDIMRMETVCRDTKQLNDVTVLPVQDVLLPGSDVRKLVESSMYDGLKLQDIDRAIASQ